MRNILITIVVSVLVFSCVEGKSHSETTVEKKKLSQEVVSLVMKDYNNIVGLLSLKYGIRNEDLKIVLFDYLKEYDVPSYNLITGENRSVAVGEEVSFALFVERVHLKTGVDTKVLASFLYDLNMYLMVDNLDCY